MFFTKSLDNYPLIAPVILYFLNSFGTLLVEVPTVRLFERSICQRYYRYRTPFISLPSDPQDDEAACKVAQIQSTLGNAVGWKLALDALPGLFTAWVYGSIASRHGLRLVLLLSSVGLVLMILSMLLIGYNNAVFPVQAAWASSIFLMIGGGKRIFNAMIFSLIAETVRPYRRTRALYLLAAGPHFNRLIVPPIVAVLMKHSVLPPFFISLAILSTCVFVSLVVKSPAIRHKHGDYTAIPDEEPEDISPTTLRETRSPAISAIWDWVAVKESVAHLTKHLQQPVLIFCLAAFFFKRVAFTSESFVYQYASEKFGWELRKTAWLGFASAAGAVTANSVVNPSINLIFARNNYNVHKLDHAVVFVSLLILSSAFLGMWMASSGKQIVVGKSLEPLPCLSKHLTLAGMVAAGLGEGLEPALQGLVAFATASAEPPQVFATLAICDTLSELVGGPVTAALMGIGRGDGHPSAGVNFVSASAIFATLMVWGLSVALFLDDSRESAP